MLQLSWREISVTEERRANTSAVFISAPFTCAVSANAVLVLPEAHVHTRFHWPGIRSQPDSYVYSVYGAMFTPPHFPTIWQLNNPEEFQRKIVLFCGFLVSFLWERNIKI